MIEFSDFKFFIDFWEDRFVEVIEFDIFKYSFQGNINSDGIVVCCDLVIFIKYYCYFKQLIE